MTKHKAKRKATPIDLTSAGVSDKNVSGKKRSSIEESEPEQQQHQQQWSKSKKKRMRVRIMKERQQTQSSTDVTVNETKRLKVQSGIESRVQLNVVAPTVEKVSFLDKNRTNAVKAGSTSSSALQKAFQERLTGSRFRILNEELYTSTSATAFQRFQQNPSLFDEYHEGFRHQVEQWPINPVRIIVEQLTQLYLTKVNAEKSNKKMKKIVVADFGCGEAELAKQLLLIRDSGSNRCPFTLHSFDLVAKGPNSQLITACDAAHTPLPAGTVDYGIFCLALMGTNLADFIREGHRVLKPDGRLFIAEVRSRFESATLSTTETKINKSN
jgi:ribosomal RNA-processing protein 8